DAAATGDVQVGDGGPHPVPDAAEVDVDDAAPLVRLVLVEAGHAAGAGIVEDGVEPAHGGGGVVDGRPEGSRVTDVDRIGTAVDLTGDGGRRVPVEVDHGDGRPFGGEAPARGPADPRAPAGD